VGQSVRVGCSRSHESETNFPGSGGFSPISSPCDPEPGFSLSRWREDARSRTGNGFL